VPGRHWTGLSFDGVDDVVHVADAGPLSLASGMTLEAWVKLAATTGWRTVMLKVRRSNVRRHHLARDPKRRPGRREHRPQRRHHARRRTGLDWRQLDLGRVVRRA